MNPEPSLAARVLRRAARVFGISGPAEGVESIPSSDAVGGDHLLTQTDIVHAYRLLLGREPDEEGAEFFGKQIGLWSSRDVLPYFVHSAEFRASDTYRTIIGGTSGKPTVIDCGEFRLVAPEDDEAVGGVITATGEYEPNVTAAFRELVQPGATVVDCGANIGYFSCLSAHLAGASGRVISVEAMASNVNLLRIAAALNGFDAGRVDVVHAALASQAGMATMATAAGTNAIMGTPLTQLATSGSTDWLGAVEAVPSLRLDDIVQGVAKIDLIKIDIEGAEGLALSGARTTLANVHPTIILEYSPALLRQVSGVEGPTMLAELIELGYSIEALTNEGRIDLGTNSSGADRLLESSRDDHLDLLLR